MPETFFVEKVGLVQKAFRLHLPFDLKLTFGLKSKAFTFLPTFRSKPDLLVEKPLLLLFLTKLFGEELLVVVVDSSRCRGRWSRYRAKTLCLLDDPVQREAGSRERVVRVGRISNTDLKSKFKFIFRWTSKQIV